MSTLAQLVIFTLDEQSYALPLTVVERVIRAVEVTPVPKAPAVVLGLLNIHGQIVPVIDIRRRLGLPNRTLHLSDRMMIARTAQRTIALVVDSVSGVIEYPEAKIIAAEQIFPGLASIAGVVPMEGRIVLIQYLDEFLLHEEEQALTDAIEGA